MKPKKSLWESVKEQDTAFDKKMAEYDAKIEELKKALFKEKDK
ncbi:hypothetical protein [Rossellomorea vietnamensis]|nr:hypothetical protein [Rossellomorea vietnamensis]